jgi:hypothetical protein
MKPAAEEPAGADDETPGTSVAGVPVTGALVATLFGILKF